MTIVKSGIPNTNNALEGVLTDLKTKLRNHAGLSKERRKKILTNILGRSSDDLVGIKSMFTYFAWT